MQWNTGDETDRSLGFQVRASPVLQGEAVKPTIRAPTGVAT